MKGFKDQKTYVGTEECRALIGMLKARTGIDHCCNMRCGNGIRDAHYVIVQITTANVRLFCSEECVSAGREAHEGKIHLDVINDTDGSQARFDAEWRARQAREEDDDA